MQCHYEVLGISKDANETDIKKSYRKLALKNHPDKNPDDIEGCTKRFHLIQQAYEVLCDPQERAWYDKHREAIVKGGLGHGGDYKDECLDVYQYFNTSCFSGYGGQKGFFSVYREVFIRLAAEDSEYNEGSDDDDDKVPGFGDSESTYEDVVGPFYGHWEGYCTLRSYVWVEKYDTRDAPNRQVRRLMEQDNKKLREKARRERNDEVRALVAFVKKRDKRIHAYKRRLEERAEEIAKLAKLQKEESRKQRLKALEDYKEVDWSATTALEKDLANLEAGYADEFGEELDSESEGTRSNDDDEEVAGEELDDEELYLDIPYCVACNKNFKTTKALSNHENSKKHRERVDALTSALLEEDAALAAVADAGAGAGAGDMEEKTLEHDISDLDLSDPEDDRPQKLSKKKKKKKRQQQKTELNGLEDEVDGETAEKNNAAESFQCIPCDKTFNSCDALNAHKKTKKHKRTAACLEGKNQAEKSSVQACMETPKKEPTAPTPLAEEQKEDKPKEEKGDAVEEHLLVVEKSDGDADADAVCPVIKPETETNKSTDETCQVKNNGGAGAGEKIPCNSCKQTFSSRNKLFEHIKKTGHALRVVEEASTATFEEEGKKGKKKKKGKK